MSKAFLPLLLARPGSYLANVSSVFGFCGPSETAACSTAKFAVRGFTDVLRNELIVKGLPEQIRLDVALA